MHNSDGTINGIGSTSGEQLYAGVNHGDNAFTAAYKVELLRNSNAPVSLGFGGPPLIDFDMGRPESPEEAARCHEELVDGNQTISQILKWTGITVLVFVVLVVLVNKI
jgi:hypothetical protein